MSAIVCTERTVDLDLPAVPATVPAARHAVCALVGERCSQQAPIELVVSEAVTNVVVHAYRDRPEPGRVRLHAAVVDGVLEVAVADDGVGLVPRPDSPGLGLGIPTMNALADEVVVEGHATGTTLRLRFSLAG